ncbi:uncharacterized protein BcabD6B2_39390 [Babesia caballi]|uniref:Uncharacterized protein n=1 Tax=Babesia caballi TaxID=5871 RepID=A0AAV4LXK4_BABCB|nr:hypothetical protein BcabD6B2_39390 [Babesia caballi]
MSLSRPSDDDVVSSRGVRGKYTHNYEDYDHSGRPEDSHTRPCGPTSRRSRSRSIRRDSRERFPNRLSPPSGRRDHDNASRRHKSPIQTYDLSVNANATTTPPTDAGDGTSTGTARPSLPYIYQQNEFIRICTDLIRKCGCESELRDFLSSLDRGASVDLSSYSDPQVRKKFRHLARALYLSRADSRLRKPAECNISLLEALDEKLSYIQRKVAAQGPYQRPARGADDPEPASETASSAFPDHPGGPSGRELLSLREMHEQGFFVGYEDVQREFMNRHASHDVWGRTPQQQLALLRAKEAGAAEDAAEAAQPWRVFDREKEIVAGSRIDRDGYDRLLQSGKEFSDTFGPAQSHTSFI